MPPSLQYHLFHAFFPIVRWLHIVAAMFIVGGALFYEFVMPHAIEDLPMEQQMAVQGKTRYVFRSVMFWGTVVVVFTGIAYIYRLQHPIGPIGSALNPPLQEATPADAIWWWLGHVAVGGFALVYGLKLTFSNRMPPMSLMRVNFVLLLIAAFLATAAEHVRLVQLEERPWTTQSTPYYPSHPMAMPPTTRPSGG